MPESAKGAKGAEGATGAKGAQCAKMSHIENAAQIRNVKVEMREQALHECDETTTHKLDGPGSNGKGTAHTLDETGKRCVNKLYTDVMRLQRIN